MFNRYASVNDPKNRNGPGDSRPTAMQIIKDNDLEGKWSDKTILITGCSSGLGIETARTLATTGAKIYCTVRDLSKGHKALSDILEIKKVELLEMDLNSLASVRACAAEFLSKEKKLNILINNAGIMAIPTNIKTADGFESQFGTNHLAHFLLFQLLKSALLAAATPEHASRVVCVSSSGHRFSPVHLDDLGLDAPGVYNGFVGYGQSKTANIYMANEIDRRYGGDNNHPIHAWSLMPGSIQTGLQLHLDMETHMKDETIQKLMKSPQQGAATQVIAAVEKELEGQGGKYLEDCMIAWPTPKDQLGDWLAYGYDDNYAFDTEKAKQLWNISCELVGYKEDYSV